jgi:tetratricopeptide (TPR) repeat protein
VTVLRLPLLPVLRRIGRGARAVLSRARRRPRTTVLVLTLLLAAAAGGVYGYACHSWHRAQAAVREIRLDEAKDRLTFCRRVWPRSVEVHLLSARVARLNGDYAEAESHLNRCMQLEGGATDPIQLEFLLMRAQSGEIDELAPTLVRLVEDNHPESLLILETMARTYMHGLQYGPAYQCLSRWIAAAPDDARPYHWRGWVMERMNHPQKAEEDYRRSLELDPELSSVRLRLAEMLLEDNQPLEALPHLERLRASEPDRPELLARMGQCRFLQGRTVEARELLTAAVGQLPNDLSILILLAKLDLQDNRPADAERWLRRVLAIDSFDTEAQYTLSLALRAQKRRAEADAAMALYEKHKALVEQSNRLLAAEAERPSGRAEKAYEIGAHMLQLGQERLGVHWLRQALLRDPTYVPAHQRLAEFFEAKGDKEQAAEHRRWVPSPDKR